MLDQTICERARLSRDARFDGRFFTGVVTTGIYCRPICPAPQPKSENVIYYPSAAAAAAAGLRPCLRCRPESAPGTAPWRGTENSVDRALTLISRGALDQGSVSDLADRLGMGDRHLRRLFAEHLGAGPVAVNNTRRLLFAKKLLTETNLPVTDIAFAAGFGSVRRFNAAFKDCYGITPGQSRRKAKSVEAGGLQLQLCYRPPYDWDSMRDFLETRAMPGVERVMDNGYERTFCINGQSGRFRVSPDPERNALTLSLNLTHTAVLAEVVERVRRMFDVDADKEMINAHLVGCPDLAEYISGAPGLRLPGAWDGFEIAVRAVLGQQVSVAAARTMAARMVERFGESMDGDGELSRLFPTPEVLAEADLTQIGVTRSRARTIQAVAQAVLDREVVPAPGPDPDSFMDALKSLPGIGPWTAGYVAMRALYAPDAYPHGDLVLRKVAGDGDNALTTAQLAQRAESWRPWRAYAALHLWRGLDVPQSQA